MKRLDSQKAVFKGMGAVSQAKIAVLAADLGIAYASIAVLEELVMTPDGLTREQAAIHRACMRIVENAAAEIVGILADNDKDFQSKLPCVPKGLGRVCHYCGCSKFDPCAEETEAGTLLGCSWSSKSIMGVWDVCTACEAEGLADGTEGRERAKRDAGGETAAE